MLEVLGKKPFGDVYQTSASSACISIFSEKLIIG
jgi:hypothetical protein